LKARPRESGSLKPCPSHLPQLYLQTWSPRWVGKFHHA